MKHNIRIKNTWLSVMLTVFMLVSILTCSIPAAQAETVAASFVGNNTVTEWAINDDGLTITIALDNGYSFVNNVADYKDAIIDGLTFHGTAFDKTDLTYHPVSWDAHITGAGLSALGLYGCLNNYGPSGFWPYLEQAGGAYITVYDRYVGLNPPGASSMFNGTTPSDELKNKYPGVKQGIINALKAGATVSVNGGSNLVIRCDKDAAGGYFSTFTNAVPVCNGGIQIVSGDILLSATLPAGVVNNYSGTVTTGNYFTIEEMKMHTEVWEYVDESRKDEAGVFAFDTRIHGADKNTSSSYPYDATYYVKQVAGNVLTEADIRAGGTMGPNDTGDKLIKICIDNRVGPAQWASVKNMSTFFTNLFRTSKDAAGYSGYSNTTYTPVDDPEWLKVEEAIVGGGLNPAAPYNVCTNKYVINYSGDSRFDTESPAPMWMFYELPKTPDFNITSDMTIYCNMIAGFYGGSGQSTPQNGQPILGMDGRYSFIINAVAGNVAVTGISLNKTTDTIIVGNTDTLTATVTPDNATDKTVNWTSDNTNVATVDSSGAVTAVAAGTANITATAADGSGVSATCVVTVAAKELVSIAVTTAPDKTSYIEGQSFDASGMVVTATYNDGTTAEVTDYTVELSTLALGDTAVTISYNGLTTTQAVTVEAKTLTSIAVTTGPAKTSYIEGQSFDASGMVVTGTYNDGTTAVITEYTYSPAGALAATDSEIAVSYGGKSATTPITVAAMNVPVTGVALDKITVTITVGGTGQLTATVTPANATDKSVTWTSSNESVATVESNGVVTAVAAGAATITVSTVDGGYTATCDVTVQAANVPVAGVSLDKDTVGLVVGDTGQLTVTVTPVDATNQNVTWKSSKPNVASVSNTGLVTAKKAGSATITITTADGGYKAACVVTVTKRAPDTTAPVWSGGSLEAGSVTSDSLILTWSAAADNVGVTSYKVYQDGTALGTVNGSTLTYNVSGLSVNTTYTFSVQAGDAAGNWSSDGPSTTVTTAQSTAPPAPTGLKTTVKNATIVNLTWKAVKGCTYNVYRSDDCGATFSQIASDLTRASCKDTGLTKNTTYQYYVTAVNPASESGASDVVVAVMKQSCRKSASIEMEMTPVDYLL